MARSLKSALVWFRRDLRAVDNAALHHALRAAGQVWCVFVFDTVILDPLPRADRRVEFIRESLVDLDRQLRALGERHATPGVRLVVRHGDPVAEIAALARTLGVEAVYANHDDDPYALARDAAVREALGESGIALHTSKDHVIFERGEVLTGAGSPYTVFTPYKNAWLKKLDDFFVKAYPIERHADALAVPPASVGGETPTLADIGFRPTNLAALGIPTGRAGAEALLSDFSARIDDYGHARDFPAVRGGSGLSVHLRFGTLSIRAAARAALGRIRKAPDAPGPAVWLSELCWRDFYQQILHHFPHVVDRSYKPAYDRVRFDDGPAADALFDAWCAGRTGYPIVDAAMAQLNTTGFMHNRLRMVSASFLVKDLGIDWRRGEAYFALHLNDYDLASNNGGWQWSASTGCDAQPYFRIFNPVSQSLKFDANGAFIRQWLPALATLPDAAIHAPWLAVPTALDGAGVRLGRDYPPPVVDHDTARKRTLERYGVVKGAG